MSEQVPIVDYLVLEESPYLEVNECTNCAARFFGFQSLKTFLGLTKITVSRCDIYCINSISFSPHLHVTQNSK